MDEIQKWNPAEVLEGIDELMNSGAVPAAIRYTPEEIIESYQLAPTMPEDEALALKANEEPDAPEEAPVMEEPAAEEPVVIPAPADLMAKMLGALIGKPAEEPVEETPTEESAEEPMEETPAEEPAEEPEEETPTEEPAKEPVEETPVEAPAEEVVEETPVVEEPAEEPVEETPVEEPAEEPVEEYSLEEIIKEVEGEPVPDKAYSLDAILKEYSEDAPETTDAEVEELVDGLDLDQMAFLIGQNVTDAMSDEVEEPQEETVAEEPTMGDPTLDGLREFFEDARRRVTGGMSRRSSKKMPEPEGVEGEPAADEPTQKVAAMPTPKMKAIRDSFGKIQDKMDDFADHMYADAVTEEEDSGEETVPATDFEQIPAEEEQEELDATIREKLAGILPKSASKAPDLAADELARRYKLGLGFMGTRLLYLCVLTVAALYVSIAAETRLPLPAILTEQRYGAALLTWLLGFGCALGLDVLWMGITAPFRGRPGMHTLTAAAILATLADGLCCITVGREGPLPFSALAMLGLSCSMLGAFWRKRALYQSCRTVARCAEPSRVTLDENKWNGDAAFARERGDTTGFGSQIQSMDGAERIYRLWVPVIGILAIAAAVLSSVGHGHPGLLTWALSGILVASAPLSGLMAFAHPYFKLTRRLDHSGAVLAGWEGAESMTGRANILLTDEDLFPEGTIIQRSVAQAEGFPLEKLTACIASMLYAAGSGLYHLFDSELRRQGGSYRRVDEMQVYEAGGFSADIRGEQVLVGSYAFMNVMGVEVPEGKRVRSSVFCAINKKMGGIFTLDYSMSHNDKQALSDLVRSGIYPVLVTRDFNIIPSMLQSRFDLPVDKMEYPRLVRRRELSERGQEHNPTLGAIVTRENVAAYADAVIGGRRLCSVVKINAIIAVLASLVGLLLGFFLVWSAAFSSLTPLSMLLFLLIWAVPNVAISGAADKF